MGVFVKYKKGAVKKSPLHQEHSNINTVGADAAQAGLSCPFGAIHLPPGGPAERILNNTLTPGESVTLYVFAGAFCFILDCTARAAGGVGPYTVN